MLSARMLYLWFNCLQNSWILESTVKVLQFPIYILISKQMMLKNMQEKKVKTIGN